MNNTANLPKNVVSLKDIFTEENILRALRESTEDQNKVIRWY